MAHSQTERQRGLFVYGFLAIALVAVATAELASYAVARAFLLQRIPFLLYVSPHIDRPMWEHYLSQRDPELGWPSRKSLASARHDRSGSRPVPAFPTLGAECVSLYGDSYVYATEVSDEAAWGNVLSTMMDCRVGNYGVGGYGTDQAVLRFEANHADVAPITILGLFPINVMRNVNQYRHLRTGESPLGFKPRFVIEADTLKFVPMPGPEITTLSSFEDEMKTLLPHESFMPDTPVGPISFRFPYTLSLGRLLFHDQVHHWISKEPSWIGFLDEAHPTQAFSVTIEICRRFMRRCDERQKKCFVVLIPTPSSYSYYATTGRLAMAPMLDKFDDLGVPHLDLTASIAEALKGRAFESIITNWPKPGMGHLNEEGNRLVAGFVGDHLRNSY